MDNWVGGRQRKVGLGNRGVELVVQSLFQVDLFIVTLILSQAVVGSPMSSFHAQLPPQQRTKKKSRYSSILHTMVSYKHESECSAFSVSFGLRCCGVVAWVLDVRYEKLSLKRVLFFPTHTHTRARARSLSLTPLFFSLSLSVRVCLLSSCICV